MNIKRQYSFNINLTYRYCVSIRLVWFLHFIWDYFSILCISLRYDLGLTADNNVNCGSYPIRRPSLLRNTWSHLWFVGVYECPSSWYCLVDVAVITDGTSKLYTFRVDNPLLIASLSWSFPRDWSCSIVFELATLASIISLVLTNDLNLCVTQANRCNTEDT